MGVALWRSAGERVEKRPGDVRRGRRAVGEGRLGNRERIAKREGTGSALDAVTSEPHAHPHRTSSPLLADVTLLLFFSCPLWV